MIRASIISPTALKDTTERSFGLTPMQAGLVYESNWVEKRWVNLEQIVVHFDDETSDFTAMQTAWQIAIAKYDMLRCSIDMGSQSQTVLPDVEFNIRTHDYSELSDTAQNDRLKAFLEDDRREGVELEAAPNWRLTWLQFAPNRSAFIWTFHHAIFDGRSFTAILEDVLDWYTQLCSDPENLSIPEYATEPRFEDHCAALEGQDFTKANEYFRNYLSGFDAPNKICLEPNVAGLANETFCDGDRKQITELSLPEGLGKALEQRALSTETTVGTLVMSAWGIALARASGASDAVFGVTRSGRHAIEGADKIAGCLINTLPQRVTLAGDRTIGELIKNVRTDQLALRDFEQTPLTDVIGASEVSPGVALFESAVVFEKGSLNGLLCQKGGAWENRRFEVLEEGALPLTLSVYADAEMWLRLEYTPSLYSARTAERLLAYVHQVLRGFAELPVTTKLQDLEMLPAHEVMELVALGKPDRPVDHRQSKPACFLESLKEREASNENDVALAQIGLKDTLSYKDLTRRSDALAAQLAAKGARPGEIVAICLPRSLEFMIAMVATMKTGAAFLPVDPTYPRHAIDHMLTDSGASIIVADPTNLDLSSVKAHVLDPARSYEDAKFELPTDLSPDRTAYVIYTSGSTGQPKGVEISYGSFSAYLQAISNTYQISGDDKVLQFASLSFDVSIEEILPTLHSGAELWLRSAAMAESLASFLAECAAFELTVLNLPTAFWHTLVDFMEETGAKLPSSVRLVIVGGEAVSSTALARWLDIAPGTRWLNGYGPTEATITSTVFEPDLSQDWDAAHDIPIGRPVGHARAYVVAADCSLAPFGAPGELWLGGAAVAKNYLNRLDQTNRSFVSKVFSASEEGAERLYRTGDRVKWRNGELCFEGRVDRQVKVNGHRIELREIERALEEQPGVALALASVQTSKGSGSRLVAWVTANSRAQNLNEHELRENLKDKLANYKIPFVKVIDAFPKTAGGKVDVNALPLVTVSMSSVKDAAPMSETAKQIAELFQDVLGIDGVVGDSSFFDLGGHSLLAVRLIGKIELMTGQRLSAADLFANPSPIGIAKRLSGPQVSSNCDLVVPIQPNGENPPLWGVHVLGQNQEFYRPLAKALGSDQPLLGLSSGPLSSDTPTEIVETARIYFDNIQSYQPNGPVFLAAVSQGSYVAYELAQQLNAAGREVALLALFDAAGPGGRSRISGLNRIKTHFGLLRRNGPKYLKTLASNRLENARNSYETARLKRASRNGNVSAHAQSIEAFVAANAMAIAEYSVKPLASEITVFRAQDSVFDSAEAIQSGLGWKGVAAGGFKMIEVPGGHLSMLQNPNVAKLAANLRGLLARDGSAATKKGVEQ